VFAVGNDVVDKVEEATLVDVVVDDVVVGLFGTVKVND
jgi:hypothetical protein